jgi:hypothetical protein
MWTCLAAAVLPLAIFVSGFCWFRYIRTEPMAGFGFAMTVFIWGRFLLPLSVVFALGFALALEWKQGLTIRIHESSQVRT